MKHRGVQVFDGLPCSDFVRSLRRDQELQDMIDPFAWTEDWYTPPRKLYSYQLKALEMLPEPSTPGAFPMIKPSKHRA